MQQQIQIQPEKFIQPAWTCESCSNENEEGVTICQVCEEPAPKDNVGKIYEGFFCYKGEPDENWEGY